MVHLNITLKGKVLNNPTILSNVLYNGTKHTTEFAKDAAIADYKNKKKSKPVLPSLIIDSFSYKTTSLGVTGATGVVFAGGPKAPYAYYVDQGHVHRGGKSSFAGHHFMRAGRDAAKLEAPKLFRQELSKIF